MNCNVCGRPFTKGMGFRTPLEPVFAICADCSRLYPEKVKDLLYNLLFNELHDIKRIVDSLPSAGLTN